MSAVLFRHQHSAHDYAVNMIQWNDIVDAIWQNVADIKKLKQAGICTIKVSPMC